MLTYFRTTTLILAWCFALSLVWSLVVFWAQGLGRPRPPRPLALPSGAIIPALVVAPVALLVAHELLGINLLYPVGVFADFGALVLSGIAPAVVLILASGLASQLTSSIPAEYAYWRSKPFSSVAMAVGRSPRPLLRRLVLVKSLATAWTRCLPWLFGELVVIEAVFNAPGLGLDAWHLARARDLLGLSQAVAWLIALYGLCALFASAVHRWIGRRLESYS